MIYPYHCNHCDHDFEVIKSVKYIDDTEYCDRCNAVSVRQIAKSQFFYGEKDWDTSHYNPALGRTVKSNAEARKIAKQMGMEEVGNEKVDKFHKHFDDIREKKEKTSYDKILNNDLGEIRSK